MITLHEGPALSAQSAHLREAADAVRAVEVKTLIAQGYQGAELGEALKRERLKAVEHFAASRR